jgi:hypothetical protein
VVLNVAIPNTGALAMVAMRTTVPHELANMRSDPADHRAIPAQRIMTGVGASPRGVVTRIPIVDHHKEMPGIAAHLRAEGKALRAARVPLLNDRVNNSRADQTAVLLRAEVSGRQLRAANRETAVAAHDDRRLRLRHGMEEDLAAARRGKVLTAAASVGEVSVDKVSVGKASVLRDLGRRDSTTTSGVALAVTGLAVVLAGRRP